MFAHLCVSALLSAAPAEKPLKPLPSLAKEPVVDGNLKDLAPALELKLADTAEGASASLKLKAAFRRDTLYVGATVADDRLVEGDALDLVLYFPESGLTSKGVIYRFNDQGLLDPPAEGGAPAFAQALVKVATTRSDAGYTLEAAFPARALPRFHAARQLAFTLCAHYVDADARGGETSSLSTCTGGEMVGGPTRLPDELRKNLKLSPPADVEGIEARERGWLGYSKLHYPTWAAGDEALTPTSLGELVAGEAALAPSSVALPLPEQLLLPDNRPIFTVLTGKNPHVKDRCVEGNELRMAMYVVKGKVANRVLEWPAANCKLGRAMRFELSPDGALQIGYTNGTTQHFTWTAEHFERAELGQVAP